MKKLLAFLISIITALNSFLFSYFPGSFDNEFSIPTEENEIMINGETVDFEKTKLHSKTSYSFGKLNTDYFNYFGIKYSSDAYVRGTITYQINLKTIVEEFFLEPGENAEFFSFIDGYLDKAKANKILSVSFASLDKTEYDFELSGIGLYNRKVLDNEIYIENDEHKLGITLAWGGSLSYLEDKKSSVEAVIVDGVTKVDSNASERYDAKVKSSHVNLINAHDTGRLVQQSYYGTVECDQYTSGYYNGKKWNYNPVQGGNVYNEAAKIVDIQINDDNIYIKCRPLDWAKPKEDSAQTYMEATYSLEKGLVKAVCRVVDFSGYPGSSPDRAQECPAFYCVEPLNRFVYYSGDKPWTNDKNLSYENDLIFWPDAGYPHFKSTENWTAFIGDFDDSFGIGLYVPNDVEYLAGVFARGECKTADPATEGPTSYIAAIEKYSFKSFTPTSYTFYLSTGTTDEIRSNFKTIKS